jgi:hypothetical protein
MVIDADVSCCCGLVSASGRREGGADRFRGVPFAARMRRELAPVKEKCDSTLCTVKRSCMAVAGRRTGGAMVVVVVVVVVVTFEIKTKLLR